MCSSNSRRQARWSGLDTRGASADRLVRACYPGRPSFHALRMYKNCKRPARKRSKSLQPSISCVAYLFSRVADASSMPSQGYLLGRKAAAPSRRETSSEQTNADLSTKLYAADLCILAEPGLRSLKNVRSFTVPVLAETPASALCL